MHRVISSSSTSSIEKQQVEVNMEMEELNMKMEELKKEMDDLRRAMASKTGAQVPGMYLLCHDEYDI